jgi:hypothetical protein
MWEGEEVMKKVFVNNHMVRRRGDGSYFSDHIVGKRGDEKRSLAFMWSGTM